MAVRLDDRLVFRSAAALRRREAEAWTRATGLRAEAPWPAQGLLQGELTDPAGPATLACDPAGCLYRRHGKAIAPAGDAGRPGARLPAGGCRPWRVLPCASAARDRGWWWISASWPGAAR